VEDSGLLGKHPAGNGFLEGGRNSLLESAQEATLTSVATAACLSQCNRLATLAPPEALKIGGFARVGWIEWTYG
jgi:hypothetical protein